MADKKLNLNFLHVCDYASFDQIGKLNILGIFENINSFIFPYTHPQFFVVANISVLKTGKYECVIKINDPDDIEVSKFALQNIEINITKEQPNPTLGVVAQFNSIKFNKSGKYKIETLIDGESIFSKEIIVSQIQNRNGQNKK